MRAVLFAIKCLISKSFWGAPDASRHGGSIGDTVNGTGDVVSTLFEPYEPYRRGPEADAGQGSLGLGLFITRQIVLAHGGDIHVRSTPEEGTTFSVRLPRHPGSTSQPAGACSGGHP